jgi:phospholipid-binding lipoprotein MlaA
LNDGNIFQDAGDILDGNLGHDDLMAKAHPTTTVGHKKSMVGVRLLLLATLALVLPNCAANHSDDPAAIARQEVNDPYEGMNRAFFNFNNALDKAVIEPTAKGYRTVVPRPIRRGIRNFLNNFESPVIFSNDLLQGEWNRASVTFSRFFLNTTVGIGGIFDVAKHADLVRHDEDFGQTLATWGAGEGPFIVLPLFGPAPPRDMAGLVLDRAFNPLTYFNDTDVYIASATMTTFDLIDLRAENIENVDSIERTSLDYYATMRSIYRQNRRSEIANGEESLDDLDDFDFDDEEFDDFDEEFEAELD